MEYVKAIVGVMGSWWLRSVIFIGIASAALSNSGNPLGTNAFEGSEKSRPDSRRATAGERELLRNCDRMQREGWGLSAECKKLMGR
jgi:hypothetical protein